jgi:hypothetical protein
MLANLGNDFRRVIQNQQNQKLVLARQGSHRARLGSSSAKPVILCPLNSVRFVSDQCSVEVVEERTNPKESRTSEGRAHDCSGSREAGVQYSFEKRTCWNADDRHGLPVLTDYVSSIVIVQKREIL